MHVILAGGGIGGLSAALTLSQKRISVTLLEQAEAFGAAGAGLQLSPNAVRVLDALGLGDNLRRAAFAPEAAEVRDSATGRLLLHTPLAAAAERRWGVTYLQVHRADLHALLLQAAEARGAGLQLGARLTGFEQDEAGVTVRLAGGETLRAAALIGCDGIRSTVREALFGPAPARFTGQVAWRGTVRADQLPVRLIPPVAAVWAGGGRHFVHYYVRGGELVNFVGVVERDWRLESWSEPGDPAELAADFRGWPEPVRAIAGAARETWRWALYDRPPLPRWSKGRVSLLGDAAHPMLPFLAQGAAMAIEDAQALAAWLSGGRPVAEALAGYEAERRPRTARVQAWSSRNARLFHLPPAAARALFGAAGAWDRLRGSDGAARFDWLYGYRRG